MNESDAHIHASTLSAVSIVSLEARDLAQKMLERDPTQRVSAKDALEHPWIVNRVTKADEEQTGLVALLEGTQFNTSGVSSGTSGETSLVEETACTIS